MQRSPREHSCDIIEENETSKIFENVVQLSPNSKLPPATIEELDEVAVSLWNACSQAMKGENTPIANEKLLPQVRATVFWALNLATSKTASGHTKIVRAAAAAARSCIEANLPDMALKILEASVQRLDSLKSPTLLIDQDRLNDITTEYYMLRVRLEFLKGRPDIADHLFARAPIANRLGNRDLVIETCYNAGISALVTDVSVAAIWLRRAVEQVELSIAKNEKTLGDIGIWNLRCRATLVRAYLATREVSQREEIKEQMENLKKSNRDALSVLVLEFKIIRHEQDSNYQRLLEILQSIIEIPDLTDEGWELVSNFVRLLWNLSPHLATEAFHAMLSKIPPEKTEFIGRTFLRLVSRSIFLAGSSKTPQPSCVLAVSKGAQILGSRPDVELGEEIIQAVAMVIWKQIEAEVEASNLGNAEQWCLQLLDNNIFDRLSDSNKIAVEKKYALAALSNRHEAEAQNSMECVLDQALALMEKDHYIKSSAHQASHLVTNPETGDLGTNPYKQHEYPSDELESLAVRAFNQALDYFSEGKDDDCIRWASKSIRLAEGIGDQEGVSLAEEFRGRLNMCFS